MSTRRFLLAAFVLSAACSTPAPAPSGPVPIANLPNINADVLPNLPTAPDNMKTALVVDPQFWADKGEELRERFNAWLAQ